MKRRPTDNDQVEDAIDDLANALQRLATAAQVRAFLEDLCTPAELEAMSDRWKVVPLVAEGVPYREIHERTLVSVTTIGRVARTFERGAVGMRRRSSVVARVEGAAMTPVTPAAARDRLRIAIQKSGRLAEPARALLASCGLSWRESRDRLFYYGESLPVDLLLVRDDDIPGLIADGVCDLGIVGRNVLSEQDLASRVDGGGTRFRELQPLGFGGCRLALAVPDSWAWRDASQLAGKRIATSYPQLLSKWLVQQGIEAQVVLLSGSVEIAPRLGQADAICDLVSSGATLAANQLKPVLTLFDSEAVLAGPAADFDDVRGELMELLLRRLDGALRIRRSKLLMFQASRELLPTLLPLLPDAEAPTVMRIDGEERLALQALCHGALTWQRLEELKRAGARGLMVLPVEGLLA